MNSNDHLSGDSIPTAIQSELVSTNLRISEHDKKIKALEKIVDNQAIRVGDLETFHEVNEATLRYVIKEELQPLINKVNSLENDKFKMAFHILKWVLIGVGGVVISFISMAGINAIVN